MSCIVCDAGPIIHLREADGLGLLHNCGEVVVGPCVHAEIAGKGLLVPEWLVVGQVPASAAREMATLAAATGLHAGEVEAIALCRELRVKWLLTDDAAARYCAATTGVEVHGTLGVVLYNAATGMAPIQECRRVLRAVREGTLYVSDSVFAAALDALERISVLAKGSL